MRKIKIIWFWIVAFSMIFWNTMKGNEWNMVWADFHLGDDEDGMPIRKQLIAKKTVSGYTVYWQDLSVFKDKS